MSGSASARRAAAESPRLTASRARTSLEGVSPDIAWSSVSAVLSAARPVKSPIAAVAPVWTRCFRFSGGAIRPASAALCQICRRDAAGAPAAAYSSPSIDPPPGLTFGVRRHPAGLIENLPAHLVGQVDGLRGVVEVALIGEDIGGGRDIGQTTVGVPW